MTAVNPCDLNILTLHTHDRNQTLATMEDLTDALMGTIKKNNLYLKSGVADEMWKCVLERQPEPGVDGEATCTVKHSEPYGAMSPDIVKHFSGNPKFSKYFTYDYPTKRMALRAEYCRKTAGFTDAMTQIMTVMRSLRHPGPFGSLRACEDIRMANGVSQEEYTLPVILASMLGVVTEEVGMNVYSETDDGKIMIRVNVRQPADGAKLFRSLLDISSVEANRVKAVDQTYQHLAEKGNSPLTMDDKSRCPFSLSSPIPSSMPSSVPRPISSMTWSSQGFVARTSQPFLLETLPITAIYELTDQSLVSPGYSI